MLDFDNEKTYLLLLEVCNGFGVDPSASVAAEDYFRNLLSGYDGIESEGAILDWLRQKLDQEFVALKSRPRWIQGPEWPVYDGKPMIFVGQWDIRVSEHEEIFHDDTSIYLFIAPKAEPKVILQQY